MATPNETNSPTRLRLALSPVPGGPLDGAWWPHSRDIEVELADLIDHFPKQAGRVDRVVFSRPDWDTHPHKVKVARGVLKTGSFPEDDTHLVQLSLSNRNRLAVLVIPPETEPETARDVMVGATAPTNRSTGSELLADAVQSRARQ